MTGDFRRITAVSTRPAQGCTVDEQLTRDEAAIWGVFGTVVEQRHDTRTGSLLTFVKVGPHGRRALEAALTGRYQSRLAPEEAIRKDRA